MTTRTTLRCDVCPTEIEATEKAPPHWGRLTVNGSSRVLDLCPRHTASAIGWKERPRSDIDRRGAA